MAGINNWISSTIDIIKITTNAYNAVSDDEHLPGTFHEAGRGLVLIETALRTAQKQQGGDLQHAVSSMEACNTKAKLSQGIFEDVAQAPEASRFERYKAAMRREGEENKVEVLVQGMMKDVSDLARDGVVGAAMKDQVKGLRDAIDRLSAMEPSVPNEHGGGSYVNHGSGNQFITRGGTQNNNTGSGNQFLGTTFTGSVSFG